MIKLTTLLIASYGETARLSPNAGWHIDMVSRNLLLTLILYVPPSCLICRPPADSSSVHAYYHCLKVRKSNDSFVLLELIYSPLQISLFHVPKFQFNDNWPSPSHKIASLVCLCFSDGSRIKRSWHQNQVSKWKEIRLSKITYKPPRLSIEIWILQT